MSRKARSFHSGGFLIIVIFKATLNAKPKNHKFAIPPCNNDILPPCKKWQESAISQRMKRLLALFVLIALAFVAVAPASHAAAFCDDATPCITSSDAAGHSTQSGTDMEATHCGASCHVSAAGLPSVIDNFRVAAIISHGFEFSDVGYNGHIQAIPTPPPSLS